MFKEGRRKRWGERNQIITFPEGLSSLPAVLEIVALYCQSNADITAFSYTPTAISSIWQNFILRIVVYTRWQSDTTQEAFFCHKSQEIRSLPYQKKSLRNKTQKKGENVNFLCLPMCIVLLFTLLQHYHKKYGKNIFIQFWTLCFHGFYTE